MPGVEDFFKSLPEDEFETFETDLREALINAAARAQDLGISGGRFPLHQWMDRRLGGELRTSKDVRGHCEVALINPDSRAVGPVGDSSAGGNEEAFFSSLSEDSFSQEEEALREAVFDFLASWKSSELANLGHLLCDPSVQACCRAFLPHGVQLQHWIERRIGAEIELHKDKVGNDIIQVTPEARQIVTAKFQKLAQQATAPMPRPMVVPPPQPHMMMPQMAGYGVPSPSGMPPPPPPPAGPLPTAPLPTGGGKGGVKGKGGGKPPVASKEQWFNSLPQDELSSEEISLREALMDWLSAWPAGRPPNKPKDAPPVIGDVVLDPTVASCRAALLPVNVSLKDWIDARIGGEVEVRPNAKGQVEIRLREDGDGQTQPQDVESILAALPEDALSEQELTLRQTVLDMLSRLPPPVSLLQLSQNPKIVSAKKQFLPDEVSLSAWIDSRIGGEVEVTKDQLVSVRGAETSKAQKAAPPAGGKSGKSGTKGNGKAGGKAAEGSTRQISENFFKSLPENSFTDGEERLRDAILQFMESWTDEELPSLSKAMLDNTVRRCKAEVLPKGNAVSLKEWIEKRLGGELEITRDAKGSLVIGIRGEGDVEDEGSLKRDLEESGNGDAGAKKAREHY